MGQIYYEHTLPKLVDAIDHLAAAMEKKQTAVNDAGAIVTHTSKEELFSLIKKFIEYFNLDYAGVPSFETTPKFDPTDKQVADIITRMKNEYTS